MREQNIFRISDLISRLSRINAAENWGDGLNPSQRSALTYLARANRFSCTPSHVADYLSATRGTISQTLKALARKGLIVEIRSLEDKRSFSYEVTPEGYGFLKSTSEIDLALVNLADEDFKKLESSLTTFMTKLLAQRSHRSFGICHSCKHFDKRGKTAYCALLDVALTMQDAEKICFEHAA